MWARKGNDEKGDTKLFLKRGFSTSSEKSLWPKMLKTEF